MASVEAKVINKMVDAERVHWIQKRLGQSDGEHACYDVGMRAARDQYPPLMRILEQMAEETEAADEHQLGRSRRTGTGVQAKATEASVWAAAFDAADRGEPVRPLRHLYGAAAIACGLCLRP